MTNSTESQKALLAAAQLIDGAELVAHGITMHLSEHPELDPDSVAILNKSAESVVALARLLARSIASHTELMERVEKFEAILDNME